MYFAIIVFVMIFLLSRLFNKSDAIKNWNHLFSNMNHDPEEFYQEVENILKEREIKDIHTTRQTFKEDGMLSHQRVYLEISRGDFIFHICAAPWGTGFFFSYWLRQNDNVIGDLLMKIPIIGRFFAAFYEYDAYYKLDTDAMFRTSVHQSVISAIDMITEAKGIKGLTDTERYVDLRDKTK